MSDTFCILPWKHLTIGNEGSVRLCCVSDGRLSSGDVPLSVYHESIDEIWNSDAMRRIRMQMVAGERISDCSVCYESEARIGTSYRTDVAMGMMDKPIARLASESISNDYRVAEAPTFIKLEVGNLCNLKCRMCYSHASSQIERDPVHGKWAPNFEYLGATMAKWNEDWAVLGPGPVVGVLAAGLLRSSSPTESEYVWTDGRARFEVPLTPGTSLEEVAIDLHPKGNLDQPLRIAINGSQVFLGRAGGNTESLAFPVPPREAASTLMVEIESARRKVDGKEVGVAIAGIRVRREPVGFAAPDSSLAFTRFGPGKGLWYEEDSLIFGEVLGSLPTLRKIYFTGGEPFFIKKVHEIIDHIVASGHAAHIQAEFSTNCTMVSDELLEKLAKFESVSLLLSLDGIGDIYEYIRFPAKWRVIERNIKRLITLPNGIVNATPALQIYNIMHVAELCRFCDRNDINYNLKNAITHPRHLQVAVLPTAALRHAASRLSDYVATDCPPHKRVEVQAVVDYLRNGESRCGEELLREFMLFTNDLDASRSQSFAATHPDLLQFIADTGFKWTDEKRFAG